MTCLARMRANLMASGAHPVPLLLEIRRRDKFERDYQRVTDRLARIKEETADAEETVHIRGSD